MIHAELSHGGHLGADVDERRARRAFRRQITRLERELGVASVSAGAFAQAPLRPHRGGHGRRLLDLGELEQLRDRLVADLDEAARAAERRAAAWRRKLLALEAMRCDPRAHRFERILFADIGQPGCGAWHSRPRLGLIGMLMGWWEVKISSGCP